MSNLFEPPNVDRTRSQPREIWVAAKVKTLSKSMTFRTEANFDDSKCILGASYVQQDIHPRDWKTLDQAIPPISSKPPTDNAWNNLKLLAGLGALAGLLGKEILVDVGKNTTLSDRNVSEKSGILVSEEK
jgi:hypothetical protein